MNADVKRPSLSMRSWDANKLRFGALLAAIIAYAALSSPTPNQPGMIEALIGVLLILAVSPSGLAQAAVFDRRAPLWRSSGQLFLAYGLSVSLISGAVQGNSPLLILRDVFPFLFLFLPLFLANILQLNSRNARLYIAAVVVAGFLFALRSLSEFGANPFGAIWKNEELTYLANAPTLLFASVFVLGTAGLWFIRLYSPRALVVILLACLLVALPLMAMGITLQRASIGYFIFAMLVLIAAGLRDAPLRVIPVVGLMLLIALPFFGDVFLLRDLLVKKTTLFGLNMRSEEWAAVWNQISHNPGTLLFGLGWGGTIESPAVAGIRVNFTHGLLSSMVLKAGIVGVSLCALYIGGLIKVILNYGRSHLIIALAVLGPVLIDVFLYASFKSLDFGLVLLVIPSLSALKSADLLQE